MAGVVLAGGESRRFGSDKASALFAGRTVFDRVVEAVAGACSPVLAVAPPGRVFPATAASFVRIDDSQPGEGPLPALLTAFEHLRAGLAFVTSCDAPLVTAAAIRALAAGMAPGAEVRAAHIDGRVQPLMAVYEVERTLPVLRGLVRNGERRLTALLSALAVETFDPPSPGAYQYRSANTQEELHTLETLSRKLRGSGAVGAG